VTAGSGKFRHSRRRSSADPGVPSKKLAGLLRGRRAVLFDFDGVLADSEEYFFRSYDAAFKLFGHSLDRKEYWRYWTNIGTGIDGEVRRHGLKLGPADKRLISTRRAALYKRFILSGKIRFIEDSFRTIPLFKKMGLKAIIASNSDPADLRALFRVHRKKRPVPIVGRNPGLRPKPSPDIFLSAAARLGVSPGECLVIEDALKGLKAARTAGMACAVIRNRHNKGIDFGKADIIFGSYGSFLAATKAARRSDS